MEKSCIGVLCTPAWPQRHWRHCVLPLHQYWWSTDHQVNCLMSMGSSPTLTCQIIPAPDHALKCSRRIFCFESLHLSGALSSVPTLIFGLISVWSHTRLSNFRTSNARWAHMVGYRLCDYLCLRYLVLHWCQPPDKVIGEGLAHALTAIWGTAGE